MSIFTRPDHGHKSAFPRYGNPEGLSALRVEPTAPGVWTALMSSGETVRITDPLVSSADLYDAARLVANWLDETTGAGKVEQAARVLKVVEEAGRAAAAWIGATGQDPRDGFTHSTTDVAAGLGDVALAALVAIESLNCDVADTMVTTVSRVLGRASAHEEACDV